MLNIFKYKIS